MNEESMDMENRKQVLGYPNYYVEPSGKVFSIIKGDYLTPLKTKLGLRVHLYGPDYRGKSVAKHMYIHTLVASLYLPNPNKYCQVIHIDGNSLNNDVSNLRWRKDRPRPLYRRKPQSIDISRGRKDPILLKELREPIIKLLSQGISQPEIAQRFDIGQSTVSYIKTKYLANKEPGVPIPDFPGYYVDQSGKVYSEYKTGYLKPSYYKGKADPRVLLFSNDKKGIRISKSINLPKLVASIYIDNPLKLPYIIHLDGDKSNNSVDNLKWSDRK